MTTSESLELNRIVKLNVGGVRYATSLATLTAAENSFFDVLFSGRWQRHLTDDGEVFLDRDGEVRPCKLTLQSRVYRGVSQTTNARGCLINATSLTGRWLHARHSHLSGSCPAHSRVLSARSSPLC